MTDHEELSRAFRERIEENYEDFKAEWENATPEEFFTDADIIAVIRFVHDECLDFVRDDQMEYLLGFKNPLEILRDYLMSEALPSLDEVHHAFQTAVDSEDVPHFYQRIDSGPSME